jgi:hypothetical protein
MTMVEQLDQARTRLREWEWLQGRLTASFTTEAVILSVLMAGAFLMFLLVEPTPRWLALCGATVAGLGMDGVLRNARERVHGDSAGANAADVLDTTPYLFLPALFALIVPVFAEHHVRGYWAVPAGLLAGAVFSGILANAVASVQARERTPPGTARLLPAIATYFVAFALFSLSYAFELRLRDSIAAAWLITTLLAVELLRDEEIDPIETLVFAGIAGFLLAQARWVLQYMPLDGALAAVALLLVFYAVTGVIHSYMTRELDRGVATEYAAVAAAGIALVTGIRAAGLA